MEQLQMSPKTYKVYKHTAPNGKCYIGITSTSLKKRFKKDGKGYEGCRHFYSAIKVYGWENFRHEILFDGLTKEDAEQKEIELIQQFDSIVNGYNISPGGSKGKKQSSETKALISVNLCGENNPFYGKHHSEETKKAQSNFMKGNVYNKGHHHTEEFKRMKSIEMSEKYKDGGNPRCKCVIAKKDNNSIKYFSLREAARQMNVSPATIFEAIKQNKPFRDYLWRYE